MLIRNLFLFLSLCLTYSCTQPSTEDYFDDERRKVVHHALKNFIISMKEKGFYAAGIGEGINHKTGKQNYLGVTFDTEKLPNVDFARRLEVEALQDFLNYINSEEGIKDFVAEYPYPIKFVRIAFISQNPEKGLFSVSNFEDDLYYRKNDPEEPIGPSIEVHQESYEDALKILALQNEP